MSVGTNACDHNNELLIDYPHAYDIILFNFSHKNCFFFGTDNTDYFDIYNHMKVPKVYIILTFQINFRLSVGDLQCIIAV